MILVGVLLHVMQSQAATEVGIGFESASSTISSSQSSTIDTTTSSTSTVASSSTYTTTTTVILPIENTNITHLGITEVVPIVYEKNRTQLVNTSYQKQLPRTGNSHKDRVFSLVGWIMFILSVVFLVTIKRRSSSE